MALRPFVPLASSVLGDPALLNCRSRECRRDARGGGSSGSDRVTMPGMKVIGAGLSRTGTMSMRAALERLLGGQCHHMEEVARVPEQLDHWHGWALGGQPLDLAAMYADYVACVDAPSCFFWRELMALHPDAKVVLTVRNPERWFASFAALDRTMRWARPLGLVSKRIRHFLEFANALIDRELGGVEHDANIETFERHNTAVQAGVPADNLLVFEVAQGWGPLCEFLELPVPDEPFPHLNEGVATIRDKFKDFARL